MCIRDRRYTHTHEYEIKSPVAFIKAASAVLKMKRKVKLLEKSVIVFFMKIFWTGWRLFGGMQWIDSCRDQNKDGASLDEAEQPGLSLIHI